MVDYVFSIKLFKYRSVRQYAFEEGCFMTNQKTKECRSTQIKIEDNNEQKEIMLQKQKNQECEYATT